MGTVNRGLPTQPPSTFHPVLVLETVTEPRLNVLAPEALNFANFDDAPADFQCFGSSPPRSAHALTARRAVALTGASLMPMPAHPEPGMAGLHPATSSTALTRQAEGVKDLARIRQPAAPVGAGETGPDGPVGPTSIPEPIRSL